MKGYIDRSREGSYRVCFGKDIRKRFTTEEAAERFLTGLRFKSDENTLDECGFFNA